MTLQTTTTLPLGISNPVLADSVVRRTQDLRSHVRTLAALPERDAPVVSCYLDLEPGRDRWESVLDRRARLLRRVTAATELRVLDETLARIRSYLSTQLHPKTRGVAVFARLGRDPYFCGLQFEVPTATSVSLDTVPNIFHLIELKDTFDRYLVLLSTSNDARIFEVHLGAVSRELWLQQPELRRRVGREWSRLQYQSHRKERDRSFVKEKIRVLERLMSGRGYAHLVLAGDPQRLAMVRRELPRTLREKVVDAGTAPAGLNDRGLVEATLATFVQEEERKAGSLVQELISELHSDGLAVTGTANSLQVLRRGQADAVLLATEWSSEMAWSCTRCTWAAAGGVRPEVCAECGSAALRELDAREEIVRLAEQSDCHVELVTASPELGRLGGVGCLLRFSEWGYPLDSGNVPLGGVPS